MTYDRTIIERIKRLELYHRNMIRASICIAAFIPLAIELVLFSLGYTSYAIVFQAGFGGGAIIVIGIIIPILMFIHAIIDGWDL
jgi:hypothetical protein